MRILQLAVESLAELEINNTHCSPPSPELVMSLVGQAWFPLCKFMLTTPKQFLVLHMSGNGFQNYLLHHLPKKQDEADWPVAPWILLLPGRNDICFLPNLFQTSPWLSWPFQDYWVWPCNDIGQLPQHLFVHPMDLCLYNLLKCSLIWSSSTKAKSSLLQTFPLIVRAWDCSVPVLPVKTKVKEASITLSVFYVFCHQILCLI